RRGEARRPIGCGVSGRKGAPRGDLSARVRRLDRVNGGDESAVRDVVAPFASVAGGLLPGLHAVQARFGYVDPAVVPVLADVFNLSVAEVHGVVSFYHDFR